MKRFSQYLFFALLLSACSGSPESSYYSGPEYMSVSFSAPCVESVEITKKGYGCYIDLSVFPAFYTAYVGFSFSGSGSGFDKEMKPEGSPYVYVEFMQKLESGHYVGTGTTMEADDYFVMPFQRETHLSMKITFNSHMWPEAEMDRFVTCHIETYMPRVDVLDDQWEGTISNEPQWVSFTAASAALYSFDFSAFCATSISCYSDIPPFDNGTGKKACEWTALDETNMFSLIELEKGETILFRLAKVSYSAPSSAATLRWSIS